MTRFDSPEDPPDTEPPYIPRTASIPVRITREVAVPIVAIAYIGLLTFLRFYDKLDQSSYAILVATPVGGYLGLLVPKVKQDGR